MTSDVRTRGDPQHPTAPTPDELAQWLLSSEIGAHQRAEDCVAAGERAYVKLREHLAVLLGATGFDALWARSMHIAQHEFHAADSPPPTDTIIPPHDSGLLLVLDGRSAAAAQQNLVIAFRSFITLLYTFIGAELGLRFICQIWPTLLPDTLSSDAEKATA